MNDKSSASPEAGRPARVAIACQGGGSHAAYVAGALRPLLSRLGERSAVDGPVQLVALSGTSGGAICALAAWWGLLTGGPKQAIERLEMFWERNSAQRPGEIWWNSAVVSALEMQPCEAQWSPYGPPLREAVAGLTQVWPRLAGWFGEWLRPDFFQLGESVASVLAINPEVDFDRTVAAIGKLCNIPADIQRWHALALDEGIRKSLGALPGSAGTRPAAESFAAMAEKVEGAMRVLDEAAKALGSEGWLADAVREFHASAEPAYRPLVSAPAPQSYEEGEQRVHALEEILQPVIRRIPRLILGAVEVDTGRFQDFSSDREPQRGGISLEAVLASAAIPYLFEAVDAHDESGVVHQYWDGLFSQNPPIKTFVTPTARTPLSAEGKPEEIWVVQVNPRRTRTRKRDERLPPTLGDFSQEHRQHAKGARTQFDIFDRRNELSGNLSLMQEADCIDAINRLLDDGGEKSGGHYRRVQVFSIPLDDKAARAKSGRSLGFTSKLCRDRRLKDALMEHGAAQAEKFFPVRDFVVDCLNQRDPEVRRSYADAHPELAGLTLEVERLHRAFPVDFHVFVEETAIGDHPVCGCRGGKDWSVTLHWRAWAAREPAPGKVCRASLTGKVHLALADGRLHDGILAHIEIDEVRNPPAAAASRLAHRQRGAEGLVNPPAVAPERTGIPME